METKTARSLLGCENDNALAHRLNLSRQAISAWGGKVPQSRQWQIELMAIKKPATRGGSEDVADVEKEEGSSNHQQGNCK